jgi:hypothetical protein
MVLDKFALCDSSGWGLTEWVTAVRTAVDHYFSAEDAHQLAAFIDIQQTFARNVKLEISAQVRTRIVEEKDSMFRSR